MKLLREIIVLFMLSFVRPTIQAMGVVAVSRSVITMNIDTAQMLRSRHRLRRYGFVPQHAWEYSGV